MIYLLAALAVYRLARLIALEQGPGGIFETLRGAVLERKGSDSWTYRGITCPLCVTVWVSGALVPLLYLCPALIEPILLWLALSGAATFLYKLERSE